MYEVTDHWKKAIIFTYDKNAGQDIKNNKYTLKFQVSVFMSFYHPGSPIKDIEDLLIQLNSDQGQTKNKIPPH